ncbi:GLPGLI family protein [Mucilaginibacter sp.]|uniref:GLPGLI family protein n=1 Tax=Mucilaginibacter sp. TaxID=1882438 RepID=UPI002617A6C5|nr:GLPGLI family protein [Mucilaginibacter sp.]MDB4924708.1 hypothetical protein [Mucilaginibacter sp.]
MKNILITIICFLLLSGNFVLAQDSHFITSGTIEFEKSSNIYAIFSRNVNKDNEAYMKPVFEQLKKTQPQFKVLKSTLTFGYNKTLFVPTPTENQNSSFGYVVAAEQSNTIYTDVATSSSVAQKGVFEETFLLKDSTRKINWKITDETREIAGYTCRRANALILDSVYVVAFYTDKILVSGGPESFTGLPGMILQVALPHENIIWRATKVNDIKIPETTLIPPKKGKVATNKTFRATLDGAMKSWGNYAQSYYKAFLL